MSELFLMRDPIQYYAWGSRTALARMQDRDAPTEEPEAELWIGAHPSAPSELLVDGAAVSLEQVLRTSPERVLSPGAGRLAEDGGLPFLLKILAIDAPLSIQVHPSREQARQGWQREEDEGIARDAGHRCYKDRGAKPETVVALTRLEILTGVRERAELALLAESLDQQWLREIAEGGQAVLPAVLGLPDDEARTALAELRTAVTQLPSADETRALVEHIWQAHPGDRGLLVALCMNHLVLEPGESMFTPAGQAHAYLQGTAVEIMECSDNVLRAGLTPKHVDVAELLKVMAPEQAPGEPQDAPTGPDGLRRYGLWERGLSLVAGSTGPGRALRLDPATCTVLCTEGTVSLSAPGTGSLELPAGHSAWVRADGAEIEVRGEGTVFAVGLSA